MKLLKPLLAYTGYAIFYIYIHKDNTLYFVKPKQDDTSIGYLRKNILDTSHIKWIVNNHIKEDRYISPSINTVVKSIPIPLKYQVHSTLYKPKVGYSTLQGN